MKKMYFFLLLSVTALCFKTQATTWTVNVKDDFFESPSSFNPVVGDVITWQWMGAHPHTVNSTSVPAGAAALSSPSQVTGTYSYTITVAGTYNYICQVHGSAMSGTFTATGSTGIQEPGLKSISSAYPNPFEDRLTIYTHDADLIVMYHSSGKQVQSISIPSTEAHTAIDLAGCAPGAYYYAILKQGTILERKTVVKAN